MNSDYAYLLVDRDLYRDDQLIRPDWEVFQKTGKVFVRGSRLVRWTRHRQPDGWNTGGSPQCWFWYPILKRRLRRVIRTGRTDLPDYVYGSVRELFLTMLDQLDEKEHLPHATRRRLEECANERRLYAGTEPEGWLYVYQGELRSAPAPSWEAARVIRRLKEAHESLSPGRLEAARNYRARKRREAKRAAG